MAWIESHDTLARHPKTRRLVRLLNITTPQAIGHLHLLWWWALEYAEQGDLTAYDDADIADAALWEGEPAIFVGALRQAGFIDADDTIHDWQDYAGKLLAQRKANADRQAAFRNGRKAPQSIPLQSPNPPSTDNHSDVTSGDMAHNAPVTVTSQARNLLTVPITVPDHNHTDEIVSENNTHPRVTPAHAPGTAITKQARVPPRLPELPLPDPYPLTPEMQDWASRRVPTLADISTEHDQFCRWYHGRENERRTNWRPVWEKWMVDAVTRFKDKGASHGTPYESRAERNERYLHAHISRWTAPDGGDADHEGPARLPA